VDKLNEMLIGALALVGGFITKRVFNNHDALTDRIAALEKKILDFQSSEEYEKNQLSDEIDKLNKFYIRG